jgi:adenylate cyclase
VQDLGAQLLEQCTGRIQAHVERMLDDAVVQSSLNLGLLESKTLDPDDHQAMSAYFLQAIRANEGLSYLSYGASDGRYYHVFRDKSGKITVEWLLPNDRGGFDLTDYEPLQDGTYKEIFRDEDTARSPPRKRPYYIAAKAAGRATWPETYVFLSQGGGYDIPGLTRAVPVYGQSEKLLGVLTADFDLIALSRYLERFQFREGMLAFLLELRSDGSKRIIAHPAAPVSVTLTTDRHDGKGRDSLPAEQVDDPRVRALARTLPSNEGYTGELVLDEFEVAGVPYLSAYQSLAGQDVPRWVVAVAIPERSILGRVQDMNRTTILMSIVGVVLVVLLALLTATRLSAPLTRIAQETRAIANFDLEGHAPPRSPITEIHRLGLAMEEMKRGLRSFRKYVPAQLVRALLSSGKEAELGAERKRITLYFSDIVGFTSIAESLPSDVLAKLLAEYLDLMTREMIEQGATIDKYIGDAIMAFWGAPHPVESQALSACRTALANRAAVKDLSRKWLADGLPAFEIRIGLHTGEALVGNFGSEDRLDYTAIGDTVNLASRLEGLSKHYGTVILMSAVTYQEVKEHVVARRIDRVAVKGRSEGTEIYELCCLKEDQVPGQVELVERYEAALGLYYQRRFKEAQEEFARLGQDGDVPAQTMAARSAAYVEQPPPEDWGGISTMKVK